MSPSPYDSLSLKDRLFLATYRFRRLDPIPFAPLARPLSSCRVALLTTGGLYAVDQGPFDQGVKGGDSSFRVIPRDTAVERLRIGQKSHAFDPAGFVADRNLGFPLDRMRELQEAGEVGALNERHLSFMGSITAPGRLVKETAPQAAELMVADGVDAMLLVPL